MVKSRPVPCKIFSLSTIRGRASSFKKALNLLSILHGTGACHSPAQSKQNSCPHWQLQKIGLNVSKSILTANEHPGEGHQRNNSFC